MARIGAPPETHYTLPADFAAALGHCVANFGWLEEIIKRTIYALDRARLADDLTEEELQSWLTRMVSIADDSMGTLIEQLDAAMRRYPGLRDRNRITDRLAEIRLQRNLLCHASWRPTEDKARWHPAFVNTRGEVQRQPLSIADLEAIRADTVEIGTRVLRVMRATGVKGYWAGDDEA
ncbi:hypothetical protein ACDP63_00080 [Paracoccus sp. P2]|uniref:Uncharacterized protein n=1 Tax=Paracoccus pantotrophus TaxID=82367 RepID=A0A1I5J7M4_PARPN|nr:hypothetical protein [Paracoccus pantotrophus]MDF3854029.1 hypothetical protein [Paracoccus pantotrophus]QFG34978.1 hypothetical protein ESD82_01915 [Paracoccus pantotrophus]QLH13222.1 hypothetical protein HYQ43_02710 [Paracoccus pantotrophus]RDD97556.1 hypothetical protein DTW92_07765 [Paracoccus pantotrophus]RKS44847.1 hypothetical protein BDE18_3703 [Paracoccus pantotrophus]